ncbi:MAG: hypothetical protein HFG89_03680 [Dorea sp.]|jgi:hypothetical protein|nr:hypothetical protein [Dorea sp.]
MKLTDKDILLVKLAVSILIVFFMVRFLIMPGIGRYQESRIEGNELEEKVEEMQTAVDSIPVLEQTIAERRKDLGEVSEAYYGRLENRQIDELLTGIAINAGLFPVSLSIGETQPVISAPYIYGTLLEDTEENVKEASSQAVEGAEQDLEREMDISEDTDSEAEAEDEAGEDVAEIVDEGAVVASGGYTLTALCNMTLQGNVDQVYQFIEKIEKNYPALQVRSMHMSGRTYLDGNWDMIEQPEVSFELAVYMHEDEME